MIQTVSCGGVVIHKGKILTLYKDFKSKREYKYVGWVLPKGTVELGETHEMTARREVKEEAGVDAKIIGYIGSSQYHFQGKEDMVSKTVHWYLMSADNFYSKPQREEHFVDSGYYKFHEAYHLIKFSDEKYILKKGYQMYLDLRKQNKWGIEHNKKT
ncbi:MAG: NUDIX domain-containing protein [Candidatus Niameybacter stercoravium]|nr:NUDIX domain-containing protein [Candidatus Niameybacter stercoravium]